MADFFPLVAPLIHQLPPEAAHRMAVRALACGLVPAQEQVVAPLKIGGVAVANSVGLAAGFDKNGEAVAALFKQGFGFVECGTVTPRAQSGNPKPRMFRLSEDRAIINRLGFNNDGLEALQRNLARQEAAIAAARANGQALGINIGKNKDSNDAVADYVTMLRGVAPLADYVTINISSPNTPGLRDLQSEAALAGLLGTLREVRETLPKPVPLWLKLAPDLDDAAMDSVAAVLAQHPVDALIISNTTITRPDSLRSVHQTEQGGLSGAPLMARSTATLAAFHRRLGGFVPLIGVGGIASPEDAAAKRAAGAAAVQLYSALVYQGFALVPRIARALV